MMVVENPAVALGVGSYSADKFRRLVEALSSDSEGVFGASELAVTERAGTPSMSVDVSPGRALVIGSEAAFQSVYFVDARFTENLPIATADLVNPRIDLVVAKVVDASFSGVDSEWSLSVVAGTAAGSPVAPAAPANSMTLAQVLVPAAAVSIVDSDITQLTPVWTGALVETGTLADGAVTAAKLATGSVGTSELATDSVGTSELATDSVGTSELATDSVGTSELATDSVGASELATDSVGASELAAGSVTSAKLATDSITTAKLADASVTSAKLASPISFSSLSLTDLTLGGQDCGEVTLFTPVTSHDSWTGSWTKSGWYTYVKDVVVANYKFEITAAGTANGDWVIDLPVAASTVALASSSVTGQFWDASNGQVFMLGAINSTASDFEARVMENSADIISDTRSLNNTEPVTWAVGDIFYFTVMYRV